MEKKLYWLLIALLGVTSINLILALVELFKKFM